MIGDRHEQRSDQYSRRPCARVPSHAGRRRPVDEYRRTARAGNALHAARPSAFLYGQRHSRAETASFLLKRGLFLVLLEVTLVNFSWRAELPFQFLFLQVIWAIGWSMNALAALIHLPQRALLAIGLVIVCGHNLLDPIAFPPGHPFIVPWAIIHQ